MRIIQAFKAFFRTLFVTGSDAVEQVVKTSHTEAAVKDADTGKDSEDKSRNLFAEGTVWTLTMLQREGRLVDFLQENIDSFDDEQVGVAVRQIHKSCSKALAEHFELSPIIEAKEGSMLSAPEKFSPLEFKMTGNVPASPPYTGILRHKGWRVGKLNLPERTGKGNTEIIQAAELSFEEN